MEHGSKTRLATALILAAVFSSGVLLGFAADSNLGAEPAAEDVVATESDTSTEEESGEESPRRRGLYMQVEPNEEQLVNIDPIVEMFTARLGALNEAFDEVRAKYDADRRALSLETREAIKSELTAEQAAKYQKILDDWDARRRAERENRDDQN